MATTITSTLTNSRRIQYLNDYLRGGIRRRFYDFLAAPIDELSAAAGAANAMADLCKGGTVRITFLSDMAIGTTPLSEVQDITPQVLADAYTDVTVDMFGDAIQTSQKALIQHFTDYDSRHPEKVGLNMMEVVDFKAMEQALSGSLLHRYPATRALLDAGSTLDYARDTTFAGVAARLSHFNCPGWEGEDRPTSWAALTDHFVLNDIASTGNVVNVAQYQDGDMVLNNEVGRLQQFRIMASGYAKILFGAGADNGSAVATTLSSAVARLAKTLIVGATANLAAGQWLNLYSTEETANTFYPSNERVKVAGNYVVATNLTTVPIIGEGENGGVRFAHPAGTTVDNADSAHVIVFGGPKSLAKVYAPVIGEFGELVGPDQRGLANQWTHFAWKWYGGHGRPSENWLYRGEFSVSEEA